MNSLLLSYSYEPITFISERKVLKMLCLGKVEILSNWEEQTIISNNKLKYPAVVRLVYRNRWMPKIAKFNRKAILKRDYYICQYCGYAGTSTQLSVDHIIPRSHGGENSFNNCVTCCKPCNSKKGSKTLEQAGMKLLQKPEAPKRFIVNEYRDLQVVHSDWKFYLGI
jgi:5-methylcytosine-specific restriction endonuclease McrA